MDRLLQVTMLGSPSITYCGEQLHFPYRQAEAILYYLFVNQSANRHTLADIIWEEKFTEEKTNSNLRNALYIIRKSIGRDFILKDSGDSIRINPDYWLELDTVQFQEHKNNLKLYRGDFLDGFFLKNNTAFNNWTEVVRQSYRVIYLKRLSGAIAEHFAAGNYSICEELCRRQIQINEFDETAYQYLMQIYLSRKEYTAALQLYSRLEALLEQELFETPGEDIQALAHTIEQSRSEAIGRILAEKRDTEHLKPSAPLFYGRQEELAHIQTIMTQFQSGGYIRHLLVLGESGIGKTELVNQALTRREAFPWLLPLSTRCYYAEEKYILKPWQKLICGLLQYIQERGLSEQNVTLLQSIKALFPFSLEVQEDAIDLDDISTLDYKNIQSIFVHALIRLSATQPLLLFFDDLQWADEVSLSLIRDIITSIRGYDLQNILFVFTVRSGTGGAAHRFITDMDALGQLDMLTLQRFDYSDTIQLASRLLPEHPLSEEMKEHLFRETEGNALFIREAVEAIRYNGSPADLTPGMRSIIRQRIAPLPQEYRQVLNLVSIFFDGVSYDCLFSLSRKEEYALSEILETLLQQNLLQETADQNDTFFSFTHQKLMEYVYDEMSWTKKRILHNKAGLYYEQSLKGSTADMALYPKLIYHFGQGSNQQKYLKYAVKYLYGYLNVTHEFFPIIEKNLTLFTLDMREETSERLSADLSSIETLLHTVENKVNDFQAFLTESEDQQEALEILSDYLHMIGRDYIRICSYEKGLSYILQLRDINQAHPSPCRMEKLLQANRQLICVYINRYEPYKMDEVIADSLRLLERTNLTDDIAIWMRLWGLSDIMSGHLTQGIAHLQKAIELFNSSREPSKHLYNLAAAYSWIGEAYRHAFRFQEAMTYHEKAIAIGSSNFLVSGVAVFYAYAGMSAYDGGDMEQAERYLSDSIAHYEKGGLMWGRSLSYSYYALILLTHGQWKQAFQSLEQALGYAEKLENPYEQGIVYRIYAQMKADVLPCHVPDALAAKKLPLSAADYCQTAEKLLAQVFSPVDQEYLNQIRQKLS